MSSALKVFGVTLLMCASASPGEWINISGKLIWKDAEPLPTVNPIDTKRYSSRDLNCREYGWDVNPTTRSLSSVVVFVANPARVHPDFPQDADQTKIAALQFLDVNAFNCLRRMNMKLDAFERVRKLPSFVSIDDGVFSARSIAIREGQPVVVSNTDDVAYNLKFYGSAVASSYLRPGETVTHLFGEGRNRRVGCLIHPWMRLSVSVFSHPYFDLTDDEGRFSIERVPKGEVKLSAQFWNYSIDMNSGTIVELLSDAVPLEIEAETDVELSALQVHGWHNLSGRQEAAEKPGKVSRESN